MKFVSEKLFIEKMSMSIQVANIVIIIFRFLIYVVRGYSEQVHSLIVIDTLNQEQELSFTPLLSEIQVTSLRVCE
ncbi:hypothetical protein T4D_12104 [Trichinella pseudospiralis]|uniref:Uncharacterized protein n=1 Tax=Trichinella pseudospiralis TaxID=6337 RepID=A0A0V1FQ83_TRIPS|nr:hypothetical protein T4D_12104 [Trichinella pseudospiralis]